MKKCYSNFFQLGTRNLSIFVFWTFGFSLSFKIFQIHLEIHFALSIYNFDMTSVAIISGEVHASSKLSSVQELKFCSKKHLYIFFLQSFYLLQYFPCPSFWIDGHTLYLIHVNYTYCEQKLYEYSVQSFCLRCMDIKWCRVLDSWDGQC